ncbi:MAG: hypothetical protein LBF88_06780 [Planctomycetaceae bacterium]|jgi:hypothetical protein|nr:hypothetical protein [Planctomycetaceae bacterium]
MWSIQQKEYDALHPKGGTPPKLTEEEKVYNKEFAGRRVVIEHSNAKIETFKSMAYPYRGHGRNRHSLRMTLIGGIINGDRPVVMIIKQV